MAERQIDLVQRRWILAALMMTMMLAAMDITIVSTVIPQIVGDLGGFAQFTWVFSIYLLAQTVTIPVYGKLADLFGRKPVLIVGILLFLAGSAASALAWNMTSLIAFRGLQGLGAGSIMAIVNTLAGDLYSVRERGRVQGWLSSVWGIAAVIGPTLGGVFAEYLTWRWIFLVNLPVGALAIVWIVRFLHERPQRRSHHIDYLGASLMLAAGGALIFALLQGGQAWPWGSVPSVVALSAAALLIAATVLVERHAAEPMMPGWIWRHRALVGSNLAGIGMGVVMMGPSTYLPLFGQSTLGLGAIAAGLVLASMSIGWPLASAWSAHLYLRFGFRDAALCGALLILLATAAFPMLPYSAPVWLLVLDQIVLGAGFGLLSTPLLVGVQSTVSWQDRGVVTGANIFARYLGQSLGAAMVGALFNGGLRTGLARAPEGLREYLPDAIDGVVDVLHRHAVPDAVDDYLRRAIHAATGHVYLGLSLVALLSVIVVLFTPRHFPARIEAPDTGQSARSAEQQP